MTFLIEYNQYLKLDFDIKLIARLPVREYTSNPLIEDLDIGESIPNIIIAYGNKSNYNNIFNKVEILITDGLALDYNNYNIPEHIKYIIVYGCIYQNNTTEINKLKNSLELIIAISSINQELGLEILERPEINLSQVNVFGNTILIISMLKSTKSITLKLLDRTDINFNQVNTRGLSPLMITCNCEMIDYFEKLLLKPEININQVSVNGYTALMLACDVRNEYITLKLLNRSDITITQVNNDNDTALNIAIRNKMFETVKKINELI